MQVDVRVTTKPEPSDSGLVGKLFRSGGARRGYWLVVAEREGYCHLLGLDMDGNIVKTKSYLSRYVREKHAVAMIDITEVQFVE